MMRTMKTKRNVGEAHQAPPSTANLLHCTFCDKSQLEIRKLIAGPKDDFICNECVLLCVDIIEEASDDFGEPTYRHCLIGADEPPYYELRQRLDAAEKLLEAAEPMIPSQYTALHLRQFGLWRVLGHSIRT
jgi:hypothetical protein